MWLCVVILIGIVKSSLLHQAGNNVFTCGSRPGTDNWDQFSCQNGTGCISYEHYCNGILDCPDGSDELFCPYEGINHHADLKLNRTKRRLKCGHNQWQCRDGSCISADSKCNGVADCGDYSDEDFCTKTLETKSGACVLPPYPKYGIYDVDDIPNAQPGQSHKSFVLTVRCRRGYGPMDTNGDRTGDEKVYCVNGKWRQDMPSCVRFCKLDPDPSITYMCYLPGNRFEVCKNYVPPGTIVDPICNSPFYYSSEVFPNMRCTFGFWDYIALCKADCGRVSPGGVPLVIGGKLVRHGELPWHAGIYNKTKQHNIQICGGSLVTNNVVISVAHCFWSDVKKQLPASNYAVAIGKIHRLWDSEEDAFTQKSDVKEIRIPEEFQGASNNFQVDLAVLFLTTPFIYTIFIRPVCLNFDAIFDDQQLSDGNTGKIAGWGLKSAAGDAAQALSAIEIPYISYGKCIKAVPKSFVEYVTTDKFCAGNMNGTALCRGDSGGGLTFTGKELGVERYFLRGLVSVAPHDETKFCNDNTYYMFTKITTHKEFIKRALAASTTKTCPGYSFQCADGSCVIGADCNGIQDCLDGSDESDEYCLVEPSSSRMPLKPPGTCIFPPYPANGMYKSEDFPESRPGQSRDAFTLTVSCSHGYGFDSYNDLDTQQVICIKGVFNQDMPKCVRYCKLDPDPSIRYMCKAPGRAAEVCPRYVSPAVKVDPICNKPIYDSKEVLPYMKCKSGLWNYIALCQAECGQVTPSGTPLIIGGAPAKRGEFPWHVGIYSKKTNPYRLYGGGALISHNAVITVAHLFWSDIKRLFPASDYAVAIGKLYQSWEEKQDVDVQNSDVKEIKIPPLFRGAATNFQHDIAVVILTTPFKYTVYIRPVCLNFNEVLEDIQLKDGHLGKVAGWGLTSPNGQFSPILKSVELPFVDLVTCIKTMPDYFREYITSDKFCAGYTNGTALCKGDSGEGIVFADNEHGSDRYYLRGILSTAPRNEDACNAYTLSTFTSIKGQRDFIKDALSEVEGFTYSRILIKSYEEPYVRQG